MGKLRLLDRLAGLIPWRYQPEDTTLEALFSRTTGKQSSKWQGYLSHYQRCLSSYRLLPISVLEIGVQAGGSLEIWAKYFRHAKLIVGCDVDQSCSALSYDDARIAVDIGDVNQAQTYQEILNRSREYEIIIDDGSHRSGDIIKSFLNLFPRLSDGGAYLVEDLHCSYWDDYGGGLYHPQSAIAFFKKIADVINRQSWGLSVDEESFFSNFDSLLHERLYPRQWDFLANIHSIEFANSLCIIRKRKPADNELGRLLMSGAQNTLRQNPLKQQPREQHPCEQEHFANKATYLDVPDQTNNLLSKTSEADAPGQQLLNAYEEIARLKADNVKLTTQFYESTKSFYQASVQIQELEHELQKQTNQAPLPKNSD